MNAALQSAVGVALAYLEASGPRSVVLAEIARAEASLAAHSVNPVLEAEITALLAETRRCAEVGLRESPRLRLAKTRVVTAFNTC